MKHDEDSAYVDRHDSDLEGKTRRGSKPGAGAPPANRPEGPYLREQYKLFAQTLPDAGQVEASGTPPVSGVVRDALATLLSTDLDFQGENTGYASHDLHAFAAKFPPQLPRSFIRALSSPGELVLDPMMGSGTTVVEAALAERSAVGVDVDPLALLLAKTKSTTLDTSGLREIGFQVIKNSLALSSHKGLMADAIRSNFDDKTRAFLDYWFLLETQIELMALSMAIQEVTNTAVKRFLSLTLSSIIVTKSGGVSRARDLAHGRPHRDDTKVPKSPLEQFSVRFRRNLMSIGRLTHEDGSSALCLGDARALPLPDDSVHLVVTSPPYANAIDYMRAHKFSLVWLGNRLSDLSDLRGEYIGSERLRPSKPSSLPPKTDSIVRALASLDDRKAKILRQYYEEMRAMLQELYRVLKPTRAAVLVLGTSTMRGLDVQTHSCVAEIATELGFDVVGVTRRSLDRNKRMMPARFSRTGPSSIENRMHEEHVIGMVKATPP